MAAKAVDTFNSNGVTSFHIVLHREQGNQVSAVVIPGHAVIQVEISGRFGRRRCTDSPTYFGLLREKSKQSRKFASNPEENEWT